MSRWKIYSFSRPVPAMGILDVSWWVHIGIFLEIVGIHWYIMEDIIIYCNVNIKSCAIELDGIWTELFQKLSYCISEEMTLTKLTITHPQGMVEIFPPLWKLFAGCGKIISVPKSAAWPAFDPSSAFGRILFFSPSVGSVPTPRTRSN